MQRFPVRVWLVLAAVLSIAPLSSAPRAAAQANAQEKTSSRETREYRRAVQSGLAEFDAGNFPEARALFTRAHELYPNARTYRGLGFVAFELRNYGASVSYLEAALASSEKPLSDSLRKSTQDLLARAQGLIARIRVEVSPSTSTLQIDGVPVELTQEKPLVLEVGDHLLEFSATGYAPERRALQIAGGETLQLSVQLHELARDEPNQAAPLVVQTPASAPRQDVPAKKPLYKNPWLWTAVGVVIVGAAVGTAVGLTSSRDKKVEPDEPLTGDNTPPGGVIQALRSW